VLACVVVSVLSFGGWNGQSVGLVLGTLLGPEGVAVATISGDLRVGRTARTELSGFRAVSAWVWVGAGSPGGYLPFLENCTVDASIFID
jgi:hypothetical protein